jgi:hypothetical protein
MQIVGMSIPFAVTTEVKLAPALYGIFARERQFLDDRNAFHARGAPRPVAIISPRKH